MMQMFREFVTPEQKRLAVLVEQKGGDSIIDNEQAMRELMDAETQISAPSGMERHKTTKKFDLVEIQHEIRDDPIKAIEKNAEFFNRKFDIQRRQIQEDIERAVSREGDRIISAVTGGPHERIVDPVRISLDCELLPNRSHRSSTKSGRTWSVASNRLVVLTLN